TLLAILPHQRFALEILEQGIDGRLRHAEGVADVRDLDLAALGQQPQHGTNPVRADGKARRSRLPAAGTAILRVSQAGLGEAIDLLARRVLVHADEAKLQEASERAGDGALAAPHG